MADAPTWTILVPTLGERRPVFERLMSILIPQVEAAAGQVRVVAWFNNGRPRLAEIRQRMIRDATTEYVCFVDDDDLVPEYYVEEICSALATRPDYVGFQLAYYDNGRPLATSIHSLDNRGWVNGERIFLRDISHLNPMPRRIATLGNFTKARAGRAEDRVWADQIRASGQLKRQVMINRIMYHYLYSTSRVPGQGSRWVRPGRITSGHHRALISSPVFSYHPGSASA